MTELSRLMAEASERGCLDLLLKVIVVINKRDAC